MGKVRPNFVQMLFLPPMFIGLIIGGVSWLFSLMKLDDPFLIANPQWAIGIGIGVIIVVCLCCLGLLYCFALFLLIIVQEVGYDGIVKALQADLSLHKQWLKKQE